MNESPGRGDDPSPFLSADGKPPFSWHARAGSFRFALRGIAALLGREHNAWLHLGISLAVVAAGFIFGVSRLEWCALVFAIGIVFGAEAFNTAVETLADALHPAHHPLVGRAKDLAAAGVLFVSLGSAAVGLLIFLPRLLGLLPALR